MLAVLGDEGQAIGDRVLGGTDMDRLPIQCHSACGGFVHAEDGPHDFAAAGAHQSKETQDLSRTHLEGDVAEGGLTGQALDTHHRLSDLGVLFVEHSGQCPPQHVLNELVTAGALCGNGGRILAVA